MANRWRNIASLTMSAVPSFFFQRALVEELHFALVEAVAFALPTRLARNQYSGSELGPSIQTIPSALGADHFISNTSPPTDPDND
jgi:hypothetical protein